MKTTVLIVDDSSFIIEGLVAILNRRGYHTIAAYSGEECLKILKNEIPDLIILDILMEPMDGWETLARIRENERTRNIPVLIFSAKKLSIEEAETYRISIDDFIAKPIVPAKLLSAIERVLSRHAEDRRLVEEWNAAGVAKDRIDAYLTIKSDLLVDTQLHAVLERQASLCSGDDLACRDLGKAISVIEKRIRTSQAKLEQVSRRLPKPGKVFSATEQEPRQEPPPAGDLAPAAADLRPPPPPGGSDGPPIPVPVPAQPPAQQDGLTRVVALPGIQRSPGAMQNVIAPEIPPAGDTPSLPPVTVDPPRQDPIAAQQPAEAPPFSVDELHPVYYNNGPGPKLPEPPRRADESDPRPAAADPAPARSEPQKRTEPEKIPEDFWFSNPPSRTVADTNVIPASVAGIQESGRTAPLPVQETPAAKKQKGGFFSRLIASILSLLHGLTLKR